MLTNRLTKKITYFLTKIFKYKCCSLVFLSHFELLFKKEHEEKFYIRKMPKNNYHLYFVTELKSVS